MILLLYRKFWKKLAVVDGSVQPALRTLDLDKTLHISMPHLCPSSLVVIVLETLIFISKSRRDDRDLDLGKLAVGGVTLALSRVMGPFCTTGDWTDERSSRSLNKRKKNAFVRWKSEACCRLIPFERPWPLDLDLYSLFLFFLKKKKIASIFEKA